MKKTIIIICVFVVSLFIFTPNLNAKTLQDIYNSLNGLKQQKIKQDSEKQLTEEQYNRVNIQIGETNISITTGQQKIKEAEEKIAQLKIDIDKKSKETAEIFRFLQKSQGESSLLEYVFGSKSFQDFIYRVSIVEQLSKYNDKLVKEMNQMIVENKQLQKDLKEKEKELESLKVKLQGELASLGNSIDNISETALSLADQIKALQSSISYYEREGCKLNEDISVCVNIPAASGFTRPLYSGVVTSEYGWRTHPITGISQLHDGIDLATPDWSKVYPTAPGRVAAKTVRSSCGGNALYIHHVINGVKYTTAYLHLIEFNVDVGDVVDESTIIAYSGGGATSSSNGGYDRCTTGSHLHFSIGNGFYLGGGYTSYYTWLSNTRNPKEYIYFPYRWNTRYY